MFPACLVKESAKRSAVNNEKADEREIGTSRPSASKKMPLNSSLANGLLSAPSAVARLGRDDLLLRTSMLELSYAQSLDASHDEDCAMYAIIEDEQGYDSSDSSARDSHFLSGQRCVDPVPCHYSALFSPELRRPPMLIIGRRREASIDDEVDGNEHSSSHPPPAPTGDDELSIDARIRNRPIPDPSQAEPCVPKHEVTAAARDGSSPSSVYDLPLNASDQGWTCGPTPTVCSLVIAKTQPKSCVAKDGPIELDMHPYSAAARRRPWDVTSVVSLASAAFTLLATSERIMRQ